LLVDVFKNFRAQLCGIRDQAVGVKVALEASNQLIVNAYEGWRTGISNNRGSELVASFRRALNLFSKSAPDSLFCLKELNKEANAINDRLGKSFDLLEDAAKELKAGLNSARSRVAAAKSGLQKFIEFTNSVIAEIDVLVGFGEAGIRSDENGLVKKVFRDVNEVISKIGFVNSVLKGFGGYSVQYLQYECVLGKIKEAFSAGIIESNRATKAAKVSNSAAAIQKAAAAAAELEQASQCVQSRDLPAAKFFIESAKLLCYEAQFLAMPFRARQVVLSWKEWSKSAESFSFYNMADVPWQSIPNGLLRLSDHWNFPSRNSKRFKKGAQLKHTNQKYENAWMLARYEDGLWVLIEEYPFDNEYVDLPVEEFAHA
jgi:hypothetical protein